MLLQSGDFQRLYDDYHCTIQVGGGDQWGNLTSALDFVKRTRENAKDECEIFSVKLITDSQGKKFGKSESGALYLDPTLTSPYHIYQYFMNIGDEEVGKYLKIFDRRPLSEIEEIIKAHDERRELRLGQKEIAKVVVTLLHGEDVALKCEKMSLALFKDDFSGLGESELSQLTDGLVVVDRNEDINLLDALIECKLASSRREARDFITGNAVKINGVKESNLEKVIKKEDAISNFVFIKRGKKNYAVIKFN